MRRLVVCLALLSALPAAGADRLAACLECHGKNGQSATALIPSLGAQPPGYALIQLYMFREKLRLSDLMNEQAKSLSDDDIKALSDAIGTLPAPKPLPGGDAARLQRAQAVAQQEHCLSCHNPDLSGHDNIPRLAGQREDYVAQSLRDYKSNKRAGYDGTMAEVLGPISDAQIVELAYYLARVR